MRWLLIFISSCAFAQKQSCLQIDIVLVGDLSGSVSNNENQVRNAFSAFVDRFELSDIGIKIGIVIFGTDAKVMSQLSSDKVALKQKISEIPYASGSTNLKAGLYEASNMLVTNAGMVRRDVPMLIIVVTDGEADDKEGAAYLAEQLQEMLGIGICAIMIENQSSAETYLKSIASPFCSRTVRGYNNLIEAMKQMDICL